MLSRVFHDRYGHGVCISEEVSASGFKVARCIFDANPASERVILAAFLVPSDKRVPRAVAKVKNPKENASDSRQDFGQVVSARDGRQIRLG